MDVKFLRRLPVIAAGLGFGAALVFVADAYDWSGTHVFIAALAVTVAYVLTILVPWLIYEQIGETSNALEATNGNGRHSAVTFQIDGEGDILASDDEWTSKTFGDVFSIPADRPGQSYVASR
jgi:hypothetical protein